MKNIVVFSSALRTSGGTTIYNQFLQHLCNLQISCQFYIFKDFGMPEVKMDNVQYINIDTVSHFRRLYFDFFGAAKVVNRLGFKPDLIISLQNTGVYCLRKYNQIVYYHNPVALFDYKWSFFDKEERTMLMYKYLYPQIVKLSTNSKTDFVVQTKFIYDEFLKYYKTQSNRVHIMFPDIKLISEDEIAIKEKNSCFFNFIYPATPKLFKNHKTLVYALLELKKLRPDLLNRIRILLTLTKESLPEFTNLVCEKGLDCNFIFGGVIPYTELLSEYKSSDCLLFPSVVETLGLPLVEAASFGIPLIASDLGYSRAVIGNYDGAKFVAPYDYTEWAKQIICICCNRTHYKPYELKGKSSWIEFFSLVEEKL